jgi:hypothetical protein
MVLFKRLVFSIALLGSVSCAHESSVLVSGASPGTQVINTRHTVFWLGSDSTWDPREKCPNGISKIGMKNIFSFIGIYASYDLVAWCAAGAPMNQGSPYGQSGSGNVIVIPR